MTSSSPIRGRLVAHGLFAVAVSSRVLAFTVLCLLAWAAVPKLVGWMPTTVASGSMQPSIMTGDVVVSMPMVGADVVAGQVVLVDDPATEDSLLLHRVVERTPDGLRLQGDANLDPDRKLVADDAVHGVGVIRVPLLGMPQVWLQHGRWDLLALSALAAIGTVTGVLATRRLLVEGAHAGASVRGVRQHLAPIGGVALAGALVVASFVPSAGATWSGAVDSAGNRLATSAFDCLRSPLGDPSLRFDFSEPNGPDLVNTGSRSNTGTLAGDVERTAGKCGDSPFVRFGEGEARVLTTTRASSPTSFTVELWFRTAAAQGRLIGYSSAQTGASGSRDRHLYIAPDGLLRFGVFTGSSMVVASLEPVTDGEWHHAVASYSAGTGLRLHLDGELQESRAVTGVWNYQGYWRLGHDVVGNWPGGSDNMHFRGDLDGVGVYDRILSDDEAAEHAAVGRW